MKKYLLLLLVIATVIVVFLYCFNYAYKAGDDPQVYGFSHKNTAYLINGNAIALYDGFSEIEAAPGSAEKIITQYFGNEVRLDLNGDNKEDVAFLVTQNTGGTGTFYYVVAAVKLPDGHYLGSFGFLLGDRIAPQTTEISREPGEENVIIVNYADREPGESFATPPSVGKSVWLKLNPLGLHFSKVEQNSEGETDISEMTLGMKTWTWINASYNDGRTLAPKQFGEFTLSFSNNGKFSATTDCNSMNGSYTADKNSISFGSIASTKMYCRRSQEAEFASLLQSSQGYHFTSKGELIIASDGGSATFR